MERIKSGVILLLLPAAIVQYSQWYGGTVKAIETVQQVIPWTSQR